jgi:hypothetical protein
MAAEARRMIASYCQTAETELVPYISGLLSELIRKIPCGVKEDMRHIGDEDFGLLYDIDRFGVTITMEDGKKKRVKTPEFVKTVMKVGNEYYGRVYGDKFIKSEFINFEPLDNLLEDIERLAKKYNVEFTGKSKEKN